MPVDDAAQPPSPPPAESAGVAAMVMGATTWIFGACFFGTFWPRTRDVKNVADLCSWTRPNVSKPALARFTSVSTRLAHVVVKEFGVHFAAHPRRTVSLPVVITLDFNAFTAPASQACCKPNDIWLVQFGLLHKKPTVAHRPCVLVATGILRPRDSPSLNGDWIEGIERMCEWRRHVSCSTLSHALA